MASIRPLIGVSTSEVRRSENSHAAPQSEPPRRELALGLAYMEAVERGGGIPVILSPVAAEHVDGLLDRLDGLCLSGGPDLHPSTYGGPDHPELGPTEPELDRFELALARRAQARKMPLLAICRGMQLLNVSRGGSLLQHLPEHVGDAIAHRQTFAPRTPTHPVRIADGSRLAELLGDTEVRVNSFHHQAVARLGAGLRPVAWARDGTIEAVETRGAGFTVAVQWHAEGLVDSPEQTRLFEGFVEAAAGHRSAGPTALPRAA